MNLKDLMNDETEDGGYDDSGNMFVIETAGDLYCVSLDFPE